jgi:hypothetical protein
MEFIPFPKMARLNRDIVVTEKIDGTNAQIYIQDRREVARSVLDDPNECFFSVQHEGVDYCMWVGSRTRWIRKGDDNFGFAAWVDAHRDELVKLGPGFHFGEWWGKGIQRGYGMDTRKFSLFNVGRWYDSLNHAKLCPDCCDVVPILYMGPFEQEYIDSAVMGLRAEGSVAAPEYKNPEGVVIYHTAANLCFKVTCTNDEKPKGQV